IEMKKIQVTVSAYRVIGILLYIGLHFSYHFIIGIIYFIIVALAIHQGSLIAINNKSSSNALQRVVVTTAALPTYCRLTPKLKTRHLCVRCLPIVFKCIPSSG